MTDPYSYPAAPLIPQTASNPIQRFFARIRDILLSPYLTFQKVSAGDEEIYHTLAFALIVHWIGSVFSYLWAGVYNLTASRMAEGPMEEVRSRFQIMVQGEPQEWMQAIPTIQSWASGIGPVMLDPFFALFKILFLSILIYVSARILVPLKRTDEGTTFANPVTFKSAVMIVSLTSAAMILRVVPIFGPAIQPIYSVVLAIIGVSAVYSVSFLRSAVVVVFPAIFVFTMALFSLILLFGTIVLALVSIFF